MFDSNYLTSVEIRVARYLNNCLVSSFFVHCCQTYKLTQIVVENYVTQMIK